MKNVLCGLLLVIGCAQGAGGGGAGTGGAAGTGVGGAARTGGNMMTMSSGTGGAPGMAGGGGGLGSGGGGAASSGGVGGGVTSSGGATASGGAGAAGTGGGGTDGPGGTGGVTGTGGAAGTDTGAPQPIPPPSGKAFVYAGGTYGGSAITVFQLDLATGALTRKGTASTGGGPTYVALHPSGKFLYVNNEDASRVQGFAIDPNTGLLTSINNAASGGSGPAHISVHKSGKWLLSSNYGSGHAAALPIDDQGRLGAPVAPVRAGGLAHMILGDNVSGNFVFVPCKGDNRIAQYKFDVATGKLEPNTPATVAAQPAVRHMAFGVGGKNAYVTNEGGGKVATYKYDATTGLLSDPVVSNAGSDTSHVLAHPSGKFVFTTARQPGAVVGFTVGADGALSPNGQAGGVATAWDFDIDRVGKFLFAASAGGNSIKTFKINDNGTLTAAGSATPAESPHSVVVLVF